ncbi:hypothetical protein [Stutzerimonas kirkiae]|uniref:Uncharacterized protein n=1 Tax=Stutzerimonas kirkiae TaxID=2211392 RepID=A0A4Q9R617_9GAMM|nr:hypothetical protein [Stutzerimonas kirkiae]TBU95993.1 hypothetical protein DNJ96_11120 [Stutzerimonas kirkiae]TBV03176.1 hypothetical protein DNJ95_07885 [Stutzerimonas kirkiae]TBV09741.1 hypothetical protein DNK08_07785 [Stutzerimonas kirkiae]TBV13529.1 hypothetical protein DNK01_11965 [Stutzerimonas kirkiae]
MSTFATLLNQWETRSRAAQERVETTLTLYRHDLVKIKAFAEIYGLDEQTITEGLLHAAIHEAESAIPYIKGEQVIRTEEGDEIFADVGKTPAYVEAEQRIHTTD